ncbi:MAG: alpha-amylase family glycosyl hydrolase, partial [Myxococcota bacterium]|nr:alpha-amylase family glycosyl hydrolase [Myxococcota bacterium]
MRKYLLTRQFIVIILYGFVLSLSACLSSDPDDPRPMAAAADDDGSSGEPSDTSDAAGGVMGSDSPIEENAASSSDSTNDGDSPSKPDPVASGPCPSGPIDEEVDLERCSRTFVYRAPAGQMVSDVRLAGSFECDPWSAKYVAMAPTAAGEWAVTIDLAPSETWEYKLVVNDEWILDPENPNTIMKDDGAVNNILEHSCPWMPECDLNADCAMSETPVCRNHRCVACDCRGEQVCDSETGQCVEPPACMTNTECENGEICSQGQCRACVDTAECDAGQVCLGEPGACTVPDCTDDSQCDPLAESCTDYICGPRPCNDVLFELNNGQNYDRVLVAGTFTEWQTNALPMQPRPGGGWYLRTNLDNGNYEYKFITYAPGASDPEWILDPANPEMESDGNNNTNSLLSLACEAGPTNFGRCGDPTVFDWRDAVMYFVMVDRFFDSDNQRDAVAGATDGDATRGPSGDYEGGDLAGVTAKIQYLQNLGVNSIWLSAPYENRDTAGAAIDPNADGNLYSGYHGYWPAPANIDYSDPENPRPIPAVESR